MAPSLLWLHPSMVAESETVLLLLSSRQKSGERHFLHLRMFIALGYDRVPQPAKQTLGSQMCDNVPFDPGGPCLVFLPP